MIALLTRDVTVVFQVKVDKERRTLDLLQNADVSKKCMLIIVSFMNRWNKTRLGIMEGNPSAELSCAMQVAPTSSRERYQQLADLTIL